MDQSQKKDAGKIRYDLVPWGEIDVSEQDYTVAAVLDTLKLWWTGRPFELEVSIPKRQLPGLARVLTFGAAKYAARGWEAGIPFSRVFAAAVRHGMAHQAGEYLDEESGLPHEAHLWCNVLLLVVFAKRGRTNLDDRPDPAAASTERLDRVKALIAQVTGLAPVSSSGLARGGSGGGEAN